MHKFDATHAHRLNDPERARILPPGALVARLGLRPGMVCVDVGAGTGFFALPMAAAVGLQGHVFAADVSTEMLAHLAERAQGAANITPVHSSEVGLPLDSGIADRVLLANVYHELADPGVVLAEAWRVLRPGGCIAVLDWAKREKREGEPGPPVDHRVSEEDVARAIEQAGFAVTTADAPEFPYHSLVTGTKAA